VLTTHINLLASYTDVMPLLEACAFDSPDYNPSDVKVFNPVITNIRPRPSYAAANIHHMPTQYPITLDQSVLGRSAPVSLTKTILRAEPLPRSRALTDLSGLTTTPVVCQLPARSDISNSTIQAARPGSGHLRRGLTTSATVSAVAPFTANENVSGPYVRVGSYYQ